MNNYVLFLGSAFGALLFSAAASYKFAQTWPFVIPAALCAGIFIWQVVKTWAAERAEENQPSTKPPTPPKAS